MGPDARRERMCTQAPNRDRWHSDSCRCTRPQCPLERPPESEPSGTLRLFKIKYTLYPQHLKAKEHMPCQEVMVAESGVTVSLLSRQRHFTCKTGFVIPASRISM